ncbi:coiled-coil protein [Legionella donaldsonii]|uniref:Coiled-coil protein n=1 Tax=Legionella donaldsonii TaxID=45060 RepID=A0A378J9L3_9GAMM|nr:hypothetical protein [Legionella donaldsonii]STX44159.1 coiled-coil protein [Legionella donaldsonii]
MPRTKISLKKHAFFDKTANDVKVSFKDYEFNLNQLKTEFSSLFQLFVSNKERLTNKSELVAYLAAVCDLMIEYHKLDYVGEDLKDLLKKKEQLDDFIGNNFTKAEQARIAKLSTFVVSGAVSSLKDYASAFVSSAKLREHISTLNSNRTHWNYSRALASSAIRYLQGIGFPEFIKSLNAKLGNTYTPDEFVSLLDQSRETLRALSVGIYGLRLTINFVTMTKHIIEAGISEELSARKVAVQEIEKRGFTMLNDAVWGTVNLLTNYNDYFQISTATASQLTVAFLVFDLALFVARWSYEDYQYQNRILELNEQAKNAATPLERAVIQRQIDILNDEWEVQCAYYLFNITAATILIVGFTASLTFTGPAAIAGLALFSMLGNAMYNSADDYKKYQQASIAVQRERANDVSGDELQHHQKLIKELSDDASQASTNFWKTLAFNTGGTAFIITAAVISWPVALGLTLGYGAYRLNNNYQSQLGGNDKKQEEPRDIYRLFTTKGSQEAVPPTKENPPVIVSVVDKPI